MRILKWLFTIISTLLILAILAVTGSALISLDWQKIHTRDTAALPFYDTNAPDGLYQVHANGLNFRARIYGTANEGDGVILLHGHPETSIMWEPLAVAAANKGYRVIAFDQRGYSPGARPRGIAAYRADNQIADVLAIADVMGFEKFHLVGHDWGAVITWSTAILHQERLKSLTAMSIPHPKTLVATVIDETPAYITLFSLPLVPEASLLFNNLAGYRKLYTEQSEEQIAEYLGVFSEPGAATATLNWYRNLQSSIALINTGNQNIRIPTLFIYGDREFWVTPEYLEQQRKLVGEAYREIELDAGHWLMQKHPEVIIAAVLDQLDGTNPVDTDTQTTGR